MKRALATILAGLLAGIVSHVTFYYYREPASTDTLEGQLRWMKSELRLTDSQFARIRELHQLSHPKLQQMANEVAQMQAEFAEFEQLRRTTDQVDFVEFARFVANRRKLNQACLDSTRQLVQASAAVMTPEQRRHYLRLITTAEPLVGSLIQ